nr:MAG TPA: hypothetical protein [Caudoviricetes sp.]
MEAAGNPKKKGGDEDDESPNLSDFTGNLCESLLI